MAKGIHQNYLNFFILDTDDTKTLIFVDTSDYMQNPENPLLEVAMPGMNKYTLVNIVARKINSLSSNSLNITPQVLNECDLLDLPDGVWTFKYKICPYEYINISKVYLRTVNLMKKLNSIVKDIDDTSDEDSKSEILDIFILMQSARASAELGHIQKASDKYNIANEKVDSLLCKKI